MENETKILSSFTVAVYRQLVDAVEKLPKVAVERTDKSVTRKGYDTTGYQYQYLVNVLNEIVGPENWTYSYVVDQFTQGSRNSGAPYYDITMDVTVTILGSVRTAPGGHISATYADAKKGALTNGLKKTLGMFGIGKAAYEGTLDDDYLPTPDMSGKPAKTITPSKTATAPSVAPAPNF